ncbi:ribosomal protein L7/L12 [Microbacterium sp. ASV49]|uniref:Ribosomal protein L7/L12 n=1 Tax=Microbacterium candidum TaxID=3041922 RepID=A0ABT7MW19_9MICO|nr:ribosomal protein L7/L12 [Microbacterium sp. ASV49]MDL9978650.1 ribosomal protein L7/L12 [Microbacterium sp. ASV49]
MNEFFASKPPLMVTRYDVDALLRGDDPGKRSCTDSRDLVHLVRYLPEGSGVRIVLHSAGGSGRVTAWLESFGTGASALTAPDLRYACALSLVLNAGRTVPVSDWPSGVVSAFELERIQMAPMFTTTTEDNAFPPDWVIEAKSVDQVTFAQPVPAPDSGAELLGALSRATHDIWVVTTLVAPSVLDQRLVLDELDAVISRGVRAAYAGAIVCARTIVASTGPVSPAVLSGLAKRSTEVEAVPIDPREARTLWIDPTRAVQGHAVAEGHAVALTRVPAAGSGKGLGIPSRVPSPDARPLDPLMPEPAVPIRLGVAVDIGGDVVEVQPDAQDARRHYFVEGKSGSGKSAFLKNMAISWLDTPYPLLCLDPHGDLAHAIAAHSADRIDRPTLYVRHGDTEHPIGLNVIAGANADTRSQNVDALLDHMQQVLDPRREGMFGDRAKRTFWLVAEAASHVYGDRLTVQVVQTLLLKQQHIRDLADRIQRVAPDIALRLRSELVNLHEKEWSELISWYQSRFQMWQRTQALRKITGTGVDAIDMLAVLDGHTNLVVDLASPQLGDPVAGILGGIYLRKLREAMGCRKDRDVPVLVLFDEAHIFQDEAPDRLLAEGRKYGLSLVIATQSIDNLTPRLARAIEANVGSYISLRTGLNGASTASARLGGWPANDLTRLPDLTAAASLSSRGIPTDPFTLHVDYYKRLEADGWTPERLADAAEAVAQHTLQKLWLPHADMTVPTDDEVISKLQRPSAPRPNTWTTHPAEPRADVSRRLDAWFEARYGTAPDTDDPRADDDEHFDVILDSPGSRTIAVIKVIRRVTGLGLAGAKAIVDSAAKSDGGNIAALTDAPRNVAMGLVDDLYNLGARAHATQSVRAQS